MQEKTTAVLFDIDGTLVNTHGAGREAFASALHEVFKAKDDLGYVHFAGATDLDVFRAVARHHGIRPTSKQEKEFFRQLPKKLERTLRQHLVTLCPGASTLIPQLAADERFLVGLLTGNTEECAKIKLQACDLHGHFVLGAFGREHARRVDLARLALKRIKKHLKGKQELGRCFIVGDTPSDVGAAKAIDATSIAVTTGVYDEKALTAAGADYILRDLSDTEAVLRLLAQEEG
jgi:phosphoglycolate phosphatase-like HAD superfamily hydrolase